MNAPTPAAQTTRLNVDFSHRLSWAIDHDDFSAYSLSQTVDDMTDRASATLTILQSEFIGDRGGRLSDGIIFNAIETAIKEIEDIKSIVNAFRHAAHKQKQQSQQA